MTALEVLHAMVVFGAILMGLRVAGQLVLLHAVASQGRGVTTQWQFHAHLCATAALIALAVQW